jgi:hypothetical protein
MANCRFNKGFPLISAHNHDYFCYVLYEMKTGGGNALTDTVVSLGDAIDGVPTGFLAICRDSIHAVRNSLISQYVTTT